MTFLSPIAGLLAGLLGAALVLLMYMLRLRRRPVRVSSTLLWRRAVRDMEGNIPWQRLSPSLLLLVHLLVVALLALALARPVSEAGLVDGQRVALVIDTTASMGMRLGDEMALERAKRDARQRVRALFDSGRTPRVSVIEAGAEPRIVVRDARERGLVLGAIDGIAGSDQPGSLSEALKLVETLADAPVEGEESDDASETLPTLVWVFSDGGSLPGDVLPAAGARGELVPSVPSDALVSNLGIVSLSAQRDRVETDLCRLFVRLGRSVSGPMAGVVRVYEGERLLDSAPVAFEDGADSATQGFELRLTRGALLRVELDGRDALSSDDRAWVRVPDPDPVRVTVVAPDGVADGLLLYSVEVVARAPALVVGAGEAVGDPDLIIYDRVDAPSLPGVASIGFGSATPGVSVRLQEATGVRRVLSWLRDDPILRDTGVGSVSYRRTIRFESPDRVLARDRDGALIVELARGGVRHVRVGFALPDSDWAVQVGFTIFMAKVFEQLLPGVGGQGETLTTGEVIEYRDAEGVERTAGPIPTVGQATLPDGRGVWVSLLDADETALRTRDSAVIGVHDASARSGVGATGRVRVDLWRWFVGGAIGLLLLEWVLYLRRVRVSL